MLNQHPITPPPELVAKWASSMCGYYEAAQWGADQELAACCEWIAKASWIDSEVSEELHMVRRPKPPSLKEQAIDALERVDGYPDDIQRIFRALEALD
jgi:hypothetical protein